jgi:hypothetical protein
MTSTEAEAEKLLHAALPFAKKMLNEFGEFLPYAEALKFDDSFVSIGATTGQERSPSKELIQLLRGHLRTGAKAGTYKATALVYDVRISLSLADEKSDAIAISINHRDRYAVLVFFPYRLEEKGLVLGEAVAQQEENFVFSD